MQQAQAAEDALFKAAQAVSMQRSQTPQAPVLLMRSPTSMTLTHRPFHLKTHKMPAFFAVYAKAFGAGVALGMNSTSMELEGTGLQQPLATRITIKGKALLLNLRSNCLVEVPLLLVETLTILSRHCKVRWDGVPALCTSAYYHKVGLLCHAVLYSMSVRWCMQACSPMRPTRLQWQPMMQSIS